MFYKKAVLKTPTLITGKQLCWSVILIVLQALNPKILLKKTLTQVFFCYYWEVFKDIYFEKYLQTAPFENLSSAAILIFTRYFRSSSL